METLLAAYLESLYKAKRAAARAAAASRADRDGSTGNPLASNSSSSEDLASAISSLLDLVQSTSDNVADLRSLRDAFRLLSTSLTDSGLASIASKLGSLVSDVLNQPRSAEARESVALAALESLSLLLHAPNGMALDSGYLQSAAQRLVAGVASLLPMAAASGNPATLARLDLFAGNLESLGLSEAAKQVGEAVIRLQMQAMQVIDLGGLSLWLSAGIDEDPIRMEARSLAICFADAFPI